MFTTSEAWKRAYPGAAVGILAMNDVANPARHKALDARKRKLEQELQERFAGLDRAALKALPAIQAYDAYYRPFKKSYHVLLQLETVALKGRSLPRVAALVEAMFTAELGNQLLTAGHDLDVVQMPVGIDIADGSECYTGIDGQIRQTKAGDMMISDAAGVISSVLYGPDQRTRIRPDTRRVLFTVYAPAGIDGEAVHKHLLDIQGNVLLIAPAAIVEQLAVFTAE